MSETVSITTIQPALAQTVMDMVWPMLESAVAQGYDVDDRDSIQRDIEAAARLLLVASVGGVPKAAAVLGFIEEAKRVLSIQYLGGAEMAIWGDAMNEAITQVARDEGCQMIVALGRPAWSRIWKDFENSGKIFYAKEVI